MATKLTHRDQVLITVLVELDSVLCDKDCECSICWPTRRAIQSLELARAEARNA